MDWSELRAEAHRALPESSPPDIPVTPGSAHADTQSAWHRRLPVPALAALALLVVSLGFPALVSWVGILAARSPQENFIQLLVLGLLGLSITRYDLRVVPQYRPSPWGFALLALAGLMYVAGAMLSIKTLFWGSFLAILALLLWTLSGFWCFYSWLPAILFSFFLLPDFPTDFKNAVSQPLQLMSTDLTTALAGLFIPITAQGNIFYIRGSAFEVTVACSGLHTWIGFMFAGMMWMLFERFSLKALIAILVGAPLLALATNTLRLFITALVAYYDSPDAGVAIHTNLEYVLFPLGLVAMWLIGRRLYASQGKLDSEGSP